MLGVGCVRFVSILVGISLYVSFLLFLGGGMLLTIEQAASFNVFYAHKWRNYVSSKITPSRFLKPKLTGYRASSLVSSSSTSLLYSSYVGSTFMVFET